PLWEGDAMFHHLLVPLDGSRMSESILPTAAQLARRSGALLTLVHVVERHAPSAIHSERHLVSAGEATAYLADVARMPALAGLRVETHVHEVGVRDVARSITEHTAELAPDLVVMSTHGTGGARRMLFGTIAQQVIAQGGTPVLLARPGREGSASQPREWSIIVAPIDGNPSHEKGLPLAADLAVTFTCRLHLLMVTPHAAELSGLQKAAAVLLPGATRLKLEMDSAGAAEYLAARAAELGNLGVQATTEASRGDPALTPLHREQGLNFLRQVLQPGHPSKVSLAVEIPVAGFRMQSKTASQILHIDAGKARRNRAEKTVAVGLLG
ncbi:MAG: universal stress protein, partial [Acidobacteriia bacterium]|nr:universal stress protein [Terriglobia bacterium]